MSWELTAAIATTLSLPAAAVAALYAVAQYQHAREIYQEQTRPYMVVSCKPGLTSNHLVDIVVANIGTTPARRVSIKVDPPFERAKEEAGYELGKARLFSAPTDMWPPGHEVRAFLDSHIDRAERTDLPSQHLVTVTYTDGRKGRWQERHVIDLEIGKGLMYAEAYGVHHAAKALREISAVLKGADVLKRGELEVTVETRDAWLKRMAEARQERGRQHQRLVQRLLPKDAPEA